MENNFEKRYTLSSESYSVERRRAVQDSFYKLQKKYPEAVGGVFWGSLVKGYDTGYSDLDFTLYLDPTKSYKKEILSCLKNGLTYNYIGGTHQEWKKYEEIYRPYINMIDEEFTENVLKKVKLPPEVSDPDISRAVITKEILAYNISDLKKSFIEITSSCDYKSEQEKEVAFMELSKDIAKFFLISVGDLTIYRKHIITQLKKDKEYGDKMWRLIMKRVNEYQTYAKQGRANIRRGSTLYPDMTNISLNKAEQIFCKEN